MYGILEQIYLEILNPNKGTRMNYISFFEKYKDKWMTKLQEDEWYFTRLRENLVDNIFEFEIEDCINYLCKIIMEEKNEYLLGEYLETLYVLCRKYNSTKIPLSLAEIFSFFDKMPNKSEYTRKVIEDIKQLCVIEIKY